METRNAQNTPNTNRRGRMLTRSQTLDRRKSMDGNVAEGEEMEVAVLDYGLDGASTSQTMEVDRPEQGAGGGEEVEEEQSQRTKDQARIFELTELISAMNRELELDMASVLVAECMAQKSDWQNEIVILRRNIRCNEGETSGGAHMRMAGEKKVGLDTFEEWMFLKMGLPMSDPSWTALAVEFREDYGQYCLEEKFKREAALKFRYLGSVTPPLIDRIDGHLSSPELASGIEETETSPVVDVVEDDSDIRKKAGIRNDLITSDDSHILKSPEWYGSRTDQRYDMVPCLNQPWSQLSVEDRKLIINTDCSLTYYLAHKIRANPSKIARSIRSKLLRPELEVIQKPKKIGADASLKLWCATPQPEFAISTRNQFEPLTTLEDSYLDEAGTELDSADLRREIRSRINDKKTMVAKQYSAHSNGRSDEEKKEWKELHNRLKAVPEKRAPRPPKGRSVEERVKNHMAAASRISSKIKSMSKVEVVNLVISNSMIYPTLNAIVKYHAWLFDPFELMMEGQTEALIASAILMKRNKRETFLNVLDTWSETAGIFNGENTPQLSEGYWVRHLVDDGDVEANPGPVCMNMDDVKAFGSMEPMYVALEPGTGPGQGLYEYGSGVLTRAQDVRGRPTSTAIATVTPKYAVCDAGIVTHGHGLPQLESFVHPRTWYDATWVAGAAAAADEVEESQAWCFNVTITLTPVARDRATTMQNGVRAAAALPANQRLMTISYSDGVGTAGRIECRREAGIFAHWGDNPAGGAVPTPEDAWFAIPGAHFPVFYLGDGERRPEPIAHLPLPGPDRIMIIGEDRINKYIVIMVPPARNGGVRPQNPLAPGRRTWADNSGSGCPWIFINADTSETPNVATSETALMTTAKDWAMQHATISHRVDLMLSGFRKIDIITMADSGHASHLSNDSIAVKLGMYTLWNLTRGDQPGSQSPIQGSLTGTLPFAEIVADHIQNRIVTINGSPIDRENCGGANPYIPWIGTPRNPQKGSFALHCGMNTVPTDYMNLVVFPAPIAQRNRPNELFVCYLLTLMPYPAFNMGMTADTYDLPFVGSRQYFYNINVGLVHIAGYSDFTILLPRTGGNRILRREGNMRAMIGFIPKTGPVPTPSYPPFMEFNIAYDDDDITRVIYYNLIDYIMSWVPSLKAEDWRSLYRILIDIHILAEESLLMDDVPSIFAVRTGDRTVTGVQAMNVPTDVERRHALRGMELALDVWNWNGTNVVRVGNAAVWTESSPPAWDGCFAAVNLRSNAMITLGLRERANRWSAPDTPDTKPYYWLSAIYGFRALTISYGIFYADYNIDYSSMDSIYQGQPGSELPAQLLRRMWKRFNTDSHTATMIILHMMTEMTEGQARMIHSTSFQRPLVCIFFAPREWQPIFRSEDYQTEYPRSLINIYPECYAQEMMNGIPINLAPPPLGGAGVGLQGIPISDGTEASSVDRGGPVIGQLSKVYGRTKSNDWIHYGGIETWNMRILYYGPSWEIVQLSNGAAVVGSQPPNTFPTLRPWTANMAGTRPGLIQATSRWYINTNTIPKIMWEDTTTCMINTAMNAADATDSRNVMCGNSTWPSASFQFGHVGAGIVSATLEKHPAVMNKLLGRLTAHTGNGTGSASSGLAPPAVTPSGLASVTTGTAVAHTATALAIVQSASGVPSTQVIGLAPTV